MYPDTPVVAREGEVNAWDRQQFRDAVKATNSAVTNGAIGPGEDQL